MKKIIPIAFFLVLCLGVSFRTYHLGQVPPGVNRDEASIGYTAYSLLKTGKDEYGKFLPVSFQSFGDWKLPVYIYESVLSVAIFGLTPFAVRIPSAVSGILLIILVYFLVKELFTNKTLALTAMFVYSISPWSIHLSRVESESNTAVLFVTSGVILLLLSFKKHHWFIIPSVVLMAVSYGTYAGNYIFTTFLTLGLFFIYRKKIIHQRFGRAAIIIFILLASVIWLKTTGANIVKISGTGIFGDPSIVNTEIETPRNEHAKSDYGIARIIHNKAVYGLQRFLYNYLNAFSPDFLFIRGGGNHAHNILNFGNLYLIEAPFFFLGLMYLMWGKKSAATYLVLLWLLIAPIAPSITKDAPHTNRMFAIFPILPIVTAFGILWVVRSARFFRYIALIIIGTLYFLNIGVYLDRYYIHLPFEESRHWGVVYEKINTLLSQSRYRDKKIIMEGHDESPYIYFLFYNAYDPSSYQKEAVRYPITSDGFVHVKSFGRYEFHPINWDTDIYQVDTIVVARTQNIPLYIKEKLSKTYIPLPSENPIYSSDITLPSGDPIYSVIENSLRNQLPSNNLPE